jgi:2-hydroxy-3-keto-5-methylthiopentenyl-1-phosphate phosphatase
MTLKENPQAVKAVPIYSNTLVYQDGRWTPSFPHDVMCHHGCANCKPVIMKKLASRADTVVLVGDGLSDRYAAKKATLTFAKSKLLDVCRENRYPHKKYTHFNEVQKWLDDTWAKTSHARRYGRWQFWKGWTWLSPKKTS